MATVCIDTTLAAGMMPRFEAIAPETEKLTTRGYFVTLWGDGLYFEGLVVAEGVKGALRQARKVAYARRNDWRHFHITTATVDLYDGQRDEWRRVYRQDYGEGDWRPRQW